jgi:hypothetical protein
MAGAGKGFTQMNEKHKTQTSEKYRWHTLYFLGAFFLLILFESIWTNSRDVDSISYSEFEKLAQ